MKEFQAELDQLLTKRDQMHVAHMAKYRNGSATRAQTTTHNARVSQLNERIQWLRSQIKVATPEKPPADANSWTETRIWQWEGGKYTARIAP